MGALCLRLPSGDHVEVAKWQTHQLEGLAPFRAWGFKSPLRHQFWAAFPQVRDLRRLWITRPAGHLSLNRSPVHTLSGALLGECTNEPAPAPYLTGVSMSFARAACAALRRIL